MKASFVAAALSAAAVAYGQSIADLPSCALSCFIGPLQSDGCGSLTDYKCHCSQSSLIPEVQPCVESKCPAAAQEEVLSGVQALCAKYGVTLTLSNPGPTQAPSTTKAPPTSYETSAYTTPPSSYESSQIITHPYPTSNNTATITSPTLTSTPIGAAATAGFGGAVVLAAGVAAMAGL